MFKIGHDLLVHETLKCTVSGDAGDMPIFQVVERTPLGETQFTNTPHSYKVLPKTWTQDQVSHQEQSSSTSQ